MIPPLPRIEDYGITKEHGFLPAELPLEKLPDPYYARWEAVAGSLQPLLLSKRLRGVVRQLPVLSTARLETPAEWRRAYVVLAFMLHGYIWGGERPAERVPPQISLPLLEVTDHLQLPPVATYAGVCLWNFRPIFPDEPIDTLDNLATLNTFTGSLDESWFYLVSVAIEARGAPLIPLLLDAMAAARRNDAAAVTFALEQFAERLDELGSLLERMYEQCDPHVFYHRIRPFLAGSKNMADAGLPNGVIYEDGTGTERYRQYGGGSNAQSSLIQFFDIVLGVSHRPTGSGPSAPSTPDSLDSSAGATSPPVVNNFILEMRSYMPGPHARFLSDVSACANIRAFVTSHPRPHGLTLAYDACLAMLRALRDKHIRMVSRYIIVKSREVRSASQTGQPPAAAASGQAVNLATGTRIVQGAHKPGRSDGGSESDEDGSGARKGRSKMRGTGGTALIPFLKQARDETGEPAVDAWAQRLLGDKPVFGKRRGTSISVSDFGIDVAPRRGSGGRAPGDKNEVRLDKWSEHADGVVVGLAGTWSVEEGEGGLCHW